MDSIQYPFGNVLLRNLTKSYPVCTHGKGVHLFDSTGKKYFDGSGGAMVATLGHGRTELALSIAEQMSKVAYVNGTQFTSPAMEECAEKLAALAKPLDLNKVALLASGSEAIEAAIKFARQLWVDRGNPKKHKLITRTPGYHGNTLYALSASGRPHYKKVYGPLISPVLVNSTPTAYRAPFMQNSAAPAGVQSHAEMMKEYHERGAEYYAQELRTLIEKEGADTISAFIFEPVSGSSTGAWTPPQGYFTAMQEICRENQILMIADEVLCGSGRTGKFFASEHYGLKPDILVLGKGINAGMMPVSAVLVKQKDVDTMKDASGGFMHAQTYMQAPSMAATVLAVLNFLEKEKVLEKAKPVADYFQAQLIEQIYPLQHVGCVTGIGHLAGVEFVANKATRAPFPVAQKFSGRFVQHAQNTGLILWPNYGQADGVNGDLVMLAPSLLMTKAEADECVDLLKRSIETFSV